MKRIYSLIAGLIVFYGCEKDIDTYPWTDGVHFEVKQLGKLCDTSEYTFAFEEATITEQIAKVRIQLTGKVKDYDRKINLRIVSADKAPDGSLPYSFNPDTCYIRKGQTYLDLNIALQRITDMQQKKYSLRLELEENEWFRNTNKSWITDPVNQKAEDLIHHTLLFSDIVTQPITWWEEDEYFGIFSVKKFLLICEVTGFKRKDFQDESYMATGRKNYIRDYMTRYFNNYKSEHQNDPKALEKIREENGTFMQMGA